MPSMGDGFEFLAIAGAVIGGTSLAGGEGSVAGTLVGVFVIGLINNSLNLLGVSVFFQGVARGALIFVAILLDTLRRHFSQRDR
jgi:ribose transport system permease protein